MKRILRLGESYAFAKNKPKQFKIRYTSLLAVLTTMCLCAVQQVSAQEAEPAATAVADIKPLQIGDTIPEALWNLPLRVVNHPECKKMITLNDYRGKLIILDFWATWCSSCIAAMPRIYQLGKEKAGDLIVIPVSSEPEKKVMSFLATNKTVRELGLFSVANDKSLRTVFPHKLIPHYAWISPTCDVVGITTSERVNAQNVEIVLKGRTDIPTKKEIDPTKPLFLADIIDMDSLIQYSVFTKGPYDGLPTGSRYRKTKGVVRGRSLSNASLLAMYRAVAIPLFEKKGDRFSPKRLILDVADATKLMPHETAYGGYSNLFNYELVVPIEESDSLYAYMLQDLNRYTGYRGRIEQRNVKCLVLTKIGDLNQLKTNGDKSTVRLFSAKKESMFVNNPLSIFVSRLNDNSKITLPVIDETDYTENVDLQLPFNTDLPSLRNALRQQNLDLVESNRQIDMFVIGDKHRSN